MYIYIPYIPNVTVSWVHIAWVVS